MPQIMSATQAKSACYGAGASPELMDSIEANGFDISDLWALLSKLSSLVSWDKIWPAVQASMLIWSDPNKTTQQKLVAIAHVILDLIPSTGAAPQ